MEMHFIPATPKGDLRPLDEAIGLAIIGHPAVGMGPIEHPDGTIVQALKVGRNIRAIGWTLPLLTRVDSLHEGLKAAEIQVLVQDRETREFYRVPRTYWHNHDLTASVLKLNPDDPGYAPQLDGQPLIVDASQQESWSDAAHPSRRLNPTSKEPPREDRPIKVASGKRGTLPSKATPSDRRHEEAAHAVAKKVRSGLSVEAAAKAVVDMVDDAGRQPASVVAAIRRAYNQMYDNRGQPHQN